MTTRDTPTPAPRSKPTISTGTTPAHYIDPFAFVPGDGRHGGIEVITDREQVMTGSHQTVCVTLRSGVAVKMVVVRGRLHLYGSIAPTPTEGQVRDAVEHLYARRSIARRRCSGVIRSQCSIAFLF